MARKRSQKNKKTPLKENNEVTLEILLSDCSNYDSWSTRVINAFRTVDPQLEQILDKSIIPPSYDRKNASEEDQRCIRINYLAYDILSNSLSKEDYHAFIMNYNESIHDAHDIWRKKKKMNDGDQTMNPPLQKVCLLISIPTYVVWLMKMIAEAQMRMRRKKKALCNSTLA
jgi:hypothetical protein